ncbi:hypothetical protein [Bradyrhizobium huanghuaihaiense]|uniref:hypothetical protein n=1 Tax=Bradyrhizobium huanghuaihaiense TaxID=990078 RepID=UPI00131567AE|nr:hypothetical protein [Bradyrhizobium huanghuaihaiense]
MTFATIFNGQIENDFRHDATLSRATAGAKNSRLLQVYTGQKSAQRANRAGAVLRICGAGILPVCFPSGTLTIHGGRPIEIQSNDRQNDAEPAFRPAAAACAPAAAGAPHLRPSAQSGSLPAPELF